MGEVYLDIEKLGKEVGISKYFNADTLTELVIQLMQQIKGIYTMTLFYSRYIYPLKSKITLSKKLKFYFDNPKSQSEINKVKTQIKANTDETGSIFKGIDIDINKYPTVDINFLVDLMIKNLSKNDSHFQSFINKHKDCDVFELLARMWIIIRVGKEVINGITKAQEEEEIVFKDKGLTYIPYESLESITFNKLREYCLLLGLLTSSDEYFYEGGASLLESTDFFKMPGNLSGIIFAHGMDYYDLEKMGIGRLKPFPEIKDTVISYAQKIDNVIEHSNKDKLLYVANLLSAASEYSIDLRASLLILVSIIEMLLTHSPDYRRFNVEDSISKQFQLKIAILLHEQDKSKNLSKIKQKIKHLYNVRSKIAHGDFKELDKIVKKKTEYQHPDLYFGDLNQELYSIIKVIIQKYLDDKQFIEFLKKS